MHPYVSMTYKCTTAPERSTYNNINKYIYILPYWIKKIKARFNKLYKCRFLYKKGNYKKAQPDFLVWNVPGSCYLHACMRDKETFLERRWFTHSFRLNVLYGNIRSDHGYHFSVFQFFHPFIILFLRYSYMPWDSCIAGKFCFVPRTKIHPFPVCKPYTPDRAIRMIVSLSEIQAETILDDSFFTTIYYNIPAVYVF